MVLFHRSRAWRHYKELQKHAKGFEAEMAALKEAIYKKPAREAHKMALALQKKRKSGRSLLDHIKEGTIAIVFALVAATLIRTMWFELYEIPSGSMRPTFQEGDRLVASKISFGLNVPLVARHIFFEPDQVQNGQVVIFCVDNMAVHDPDTTYFLLFRGKRMLIKRLIGKPGDSLYFYGGKIYGAHSNDETFTIAMDHVPFITFEGRTDVSNRTITFEQSGYPVGKIEFPNRASVYKDGHWVKGDYFGKRWGLENYAMTKMIGNELHIATFPLLQDPLVFTNNHVLLRPIVSRITLNDLHKERLWNNLSTARFTVDPKNFPLPGIPEGTYQMTKGVWEKITFWGQAIPIEKSHPLYNKEFLPFFFNSGIDFLTIYTKTDLPLYPQRFAYFEKGALKVAGATIFEADDPALGPFIEEQKGKKYPFVDHQRELSAAFIKENGLKVPEKMYYVLGDNYSMSADSRDFGFVPEDNIRGTPSFIFWPPGERWGSPNEPTAPWLSLPHVVMAVLVAAVCFASWRYYYRIPHD